MEWLRAVSVLAERVGCDVQSKKGYAVHLSSNPSLPSPFLFCSEIICIFLPIIITGSSWRMSSVILSRTPSTLAGRPSRRWTSSMLLSVKERRCTVSEDSWRESLSYVGRTDRTDIFCRSGILRKKKKKSVATKEAVESYGTSCRRSRAQQAKYIFWLPHYDDEDSTSTVEK